MAKFNDWQIFRLYDIICFVIILLDELQLDITSSQDTAQEETPESQRGILYIIYINMLASLARRYVNTV